MASNDGEIVDGASMSIARLKSNLKGMLSRELISIILYVVFAAGALERVLSFVCLLSCINGFLVPLSCSTFSARESTYHTPARKLGKSYHSRFVVHDSLLLLSSKHHTSFVGSLMVRSSYFIVVDYQLGVYRSNFFHKLETFLDWFFYFWSCLYWFMVQ